MKTMWAPWRMEYILSEKTEVCVFCDGFAKNDDLTLLKGDDTMVMMNKYPYICLLYTSDAADERG